MNSLLLRHILSAAIVAALGLLSLLLMGAAPPETDRGADQKALLAHHEASLKAHRENNPEWFIRDRAAEYILVNRGEILRPTNEQTLARFTDYLGRTRFTEYRDLVPPVVRISEDGTMGWIAVQVKVVGVQTRPDGTEETIDVVWAWVSMYQKHEDRWINTGNASNRRP
jgi:hypothetical protein